MWGLLSFFYGILRFYVVGLVFYRSRNLSKKKITKTQKITSYFFQETYPRFTITLSPPIWNFFRLLWKTEKKMFGYDFDHLLLIDSFFSTSFEDARKLLVVVVWHDKGRLFWGGCRTVWALNWIGEGFSVTASFPWVKIPYSF